MTAKRYTLQTASGEPQLFAKKDSAIRAGEKIGEPFTVLSPAGAVVHEYTEVSIEGIDADDTLIGGKADADELALQAEEDEDLIGDVAPKPEAEGSYAFPGNYSISFVPFAQTLADAVGGLTTHVEKPGGLTRVFHFAGSSEAVEDLKSILRDAVPATLEALHVWQKENRESRKGLTDMQKFLQHRKFIEDHAVTIAEQL